METNMAETEMVSESELQAVKLLPKRRRILDPSAIVPVPVYSNKVSSSLQLRPPPALFTEKESTDDVADDGLWSEFSCQGKLPSFISLSDSEDEAKQSKSEPTTKRQAKTTHCPSPPPPESPVKKRSRKVQRKIRELDVTLQTIKSLLSPDTQSSRFSRSSRQDRDDDDDDDDVIIVSPMLGSQSSPYSSSVREIPLKIRCRAEVHRIPVLSSSPLSAVVAQLSVILNVPPPRLLLLRKDVELPTDSTIDELGLGIADIIECDVMAAKDKGVSADNDSIITVRLQSKDRDASQEFSLHREAPLGSIFSQYISRMFTHDCRKAQFLFDGSKVTAQQTPAELDMEDGDIIEVWI